MWGGWGGVGCGVGDVGRGGAGMWVGWGGMWVAPLLEDGERAMARGVPRFLECFKFGFRVATYLVLGWDRFLVFSGICLFFGRRAFFSSWHLPGSGFGRYVHLGC